MHTTAQWFAVTEMVDLMNQIENWLGQVTSTIYFLVACALDLVGLSTGACVGF